MPAPGNVYSRMDEATLIRRCLTGETDAYGELVSRHRERVHMLAFQMTRNHADADELSQQAFLKAYEALPNFRSDAVFFTWIYRITVNLSLTYLQRRNRTVPLPEPASEDFHSGPELSVLDPVEDRLEARDDAAELGKALESLNPELRSAVVLVYLEGLSPRDASHTLGCAEATVHWRLFKARKLLKNLLKENP